MKGTLIVTAIILVIVALYFLIRQEYIDTHCAMVLGSMVCQH
jgi:hypothetical protein